MERWRVVHKESDFTVIDNGLFRDSDLSTAERGFLCTVLSLPEDWEFSTKGMSEILPEGISAIKAIINRLIKHGYCKKGRVFDRNSGRIVGYEYTFYEVKNGSKCTLNPQTDFPSVENPSVESPSVENQHQLNTISNQVLNKSNTNRGSAFSPPTRDQVREFFRERKFNSDPDAFWLHFENCNWKLSSGRGAKMKDWRLAAISWEKRENQFKR